MHLRILNAVQKHSRYIDLPADILLHFDWTCPFQPCEICDILPVECEGSFRCSYQSCPSATQAKEEEE